MNKLFRFDLLPYALLLFAVLGLPNQASADFEDLLKKTPGDANVIVLIDAAKIFQSEVAVAGNWKQKFEDNYGQAPLRMPPEAAQFILAAEVNLATLTPIRETAIMRTNADMPMSAVRRLVKGTADNFGELEAVQTPKGDFVVKFGPQEFGMMSPGNRQSVNRWISSVSQANGTSTLTPYLSKSAAYPDKVGTEIIMAMDLTGAIGASAIEQKLQSSEVIKASGVDAKVAAKILASLEGLTLGVRVTDMAHGSLKVDFSQPIDAISSIAQPLLLEILEKEGSSINEFYTWKSQPTKTGFRISGNFDQGGLQRIFSFLELDATVIDQASTTDKNAEGSATPANPADRYTIDTDATREYFEGVEKYLHDLSRETGAKSYFTIATWFEKYAKRIDRMPILHIDPQLVDFSSHVVGQMRDCSEAIRGAGVKEGARSATVHGSSSYYDSNSYNDGYFGGGSVVGGNAQQVDGVRNAETERRTIRKQERAASSMTVRGIVRQMEEDTSRMRRELTEKYQIEF